jgi:O-Antigen ligase
MPRAVGICATAVLLVGPAILAFFAGGYFDGPRVVAAAIAWGLVFLLALAGPLPLPASRSGRVAMAALAALAIWSAISLAWAPLIGPTLDSVERILLYLAVLMVAVAVLREARAVRWVEPVLALGTLVVIGYGLAGRLLPGLIDLLSKRSYGAGGRLEQPITYWNSEGLLAGLGLILCVRLAGDTSRPGAVRAGAVAACAPLGAGVYLSYSRGALAVTLLGLIVLLAAAPTRPQLRATAVAIVTGIAAALAASAFEGVASLTGSAAQQERDGAIVLVLLLVIMGAAALASVAGLRAERRGTFRLGTLVHARRLPAAAAAAVALCAVSLVVGGLGEDAKAESAASKPSRFASLNSVRYEYWRVGLDAFSSAPLHGVGAGGYRVVWRQERRVPYSATEVHSLPLEMAAELGLVGLGLFALFVGALGVAGRRALAQRASLAPGAVAVCVAWLLHAAIDWDWQLPAVTLPALVLAGGLLAAGERQRPNHAIADWVGAGQRKPEPVTVAAR